MSSGPELYIRLKCPNCERWGPVRISVKDGDHQDAWKIHTVGGLTDRLCDRCDYEWTEACLDDAENG